MRSPRGLTRYWKGSESHGAYVVPRLLFDKVRVFDPSPLSVVVVEGGPEADESRSRLAERPRVVAPIVTNDVPPPPHRE